MQGSVGRWGAGVWRWGLFGLLTTWLGVGIVGCEGTLTADPRMKRLEGVWVLDLAVNQELVDQLLDGDPSRAQTFQEKMLRGAAKQFIAGKMPELTEKLEGAANRSMQLEFTSAGAWSSKTALPVARGQKAGTWTVQSADELSMRILCVWRESQSTPSESVETVVHFVAPDRIRLVPPNMAGTELELTFVKQPAN